MTAVERDRVGQLTDGTVTLRRPVDADADALAAAVRASYRELAPFMPWAKPDHDASDVIGWIRGGDDATGDEFVVVDDDDVPIGSCGLNRFDEINAWANLGYWVATAAAGRGVATAATRLVARYGFEHRRLARIEIMMSVENPASRRVAERAGARFEGTLRSRLLLRERRHDAHVFSLLPGDLIG